MQLIPYSLYPLVIKPFLFMMDAEKAHDLIIRSAAFLSKAPLKNIFAQQVAFRPVEVMGLIFKNPVGLAAGLDKNGEAIDYFGSLGFGHIEVGTVTPNVAQAVKNAKAGQVRYRNDKSGIIHAGIGKVDFDSNKLKENLEAIVSAVKKQKPATSKGTYIKKIAVNGELTYYDMQNAAPLVNAMRTINNNVNQIAHWANTARSIREPEIVEATVLANKAWELVKNGL